jgi:hypothetical protein
MRYIAAQFRMSLLSISQRGQRNNATSLEV